MFSWINVWDLNHVLLFEGVVDFFVKVLHGTRLIFVFS